MKRLLLVPMMLVLLLPVSASALVVQFDTWGGNVSSDYTVQIDDGFTAGKIRFTATVDAGFTAKMLAVAFDTVAPVYTSMNLDLMMVTPLVPGGTSAFNTLVCNPNQGCDFNGATMDPFDVIVRFADQGAGVATAIFEISDVGGAVSASSFTRVGIRAQDTGPVSCITQQNCDSDKAISTTGTVPPSEVPEPGALLLLGTGLLLLRLSTKAKR